MGGSSSSIYMLNDMLQSGAEGEGDTHTQKIERMYAKRKKEEESTVSGKSEDEIYVKE